MVKSHGGTKTKYIYFEVNDTFKQYAKNKILWLRTKTVQLNDKDTHEQFSKKLDMRNMKFVDLLILIALCGFNIKSHLFARSSTFNTSEIVPWIH